MSNFEANQELCIAKLKALAAENKFDAYETDIPVGTVRPDTNYSTTPYVLIDFGNKNQATSNNLGITGFRDDIKSLAIVFEIVSNNPAVSRRIANIVTDAFDGYQPDKTWSEFAGHITSPPITVRPSDGGALYPPRYHRTIAYVVDVDA